MKLYDKKIRSVSALESEKQLLLQQKQLLEKDELFSVEGIMSSVGNDIKGSAGKLMEGLLPDSSSYMGHVFSLVTGIIKNRFKRKGSAKKEKHTESGESYTEKKKGSSVLKTAAAALVGDTPKWDEVALSYKGVTLSLHKQKTHNADVKGAATNEA